jgi:hypothetical protein
MPTIIPFFFRMMTVFALLAFMAACTTTSSTEATSESIGTTSEGTSDITSSTTPGEEPTLSEVDEALEFTIANLDHIKTDMAAGGGEYLKALATLLGVSVSNQEAFFAITKEKFSDLYSSDKTTAKELVEKLMAEISAHPELRD